MFVSYFDLLKFWVTLFDDNFLIFFFSINENIPRPCCSTHIASIGKVLTCNNYPDSFVREYCQRFYLDWIILGEI